MKGLIEGEDAREYDKKIKNKTFSKKIDSFILNNIKGNSFLDLCCGSGNTISLLEKKGVIYGVDGSKEMITICEEKFSKKKNVHLLLEDVTNISLKKQFDSIIIRMSLHHIKDKEKVLEKCHKLLKNNGQLIIIDKVVNNFMIKFLINIKNLFKLLFFGKKSFLLHRYITKKNFEKLLKNHFKIKSITYEDSKKLTKRTHVVLKK